jgi:hypothetical protein
MKKIWKLDEQGMLLSFGKMEKRLVFQYQVKPAPSVVANTRLLRFKDLYSLKKKLKILENLWLNASSLAQGS